MVVLTQDCSDVAAVSYYQHNGHYTRIGFDSSGTHPVVYSGKLAHGSYHDSNTFSSPTGGECTYYGDFRNPESRAAYLQTWTNLIDLDGDQESWIVDDKTATSMWSLDDVSTHPTKHNPVDSEHSVACKGCATFGVADANCYQSECLCGDDETMTNCLKECEPDYVNIGLYCGKDR
ncbi:unnamed protein product [Rotaria magnacalcarata]|uniref:Uncharacterized protein n=1 Tax=Rotaria magnacalcarata TaxID=392030 RepID=A0A816CWD4_9BILA|nr:unnamed protein product [Rotaria magnacalcarata]CAF1625480.1 unnamed protein product [Rotaria magnacalcarata]CAF2126416.1 unnamed protein product [Rotaria magnacalcarata]CAF3952059.1 unnamed protein product [Rotaria magnacalcarata]CAF4450598.1 unnamed protein product [Rotaria magnacalcarata]